ncbi:NAD dependent epimerase/dehydratase [Legionella antarctica]|uniref:NAD dependent epimerase/dehydratase n=1 Tax=Legionella antarctica TaxID=2708020 RepID=A0A6F8T3Z2_9GAMM|nr:NAD-dependent epimerase/dehydratase family protein [Legionella antarctica]BCA94923.1 NAD dependent epimerase/dehydratase [Legionella antarctica]
MSKVLVTGGTGFIGKKLISALILAGHDVRCAVSRKVEELNVEQVVINKIELQDDWSEVLQGIDTVIHLAARVHIMDKNPSLDEYYKVNTIPTKNLAEQAAQHQVKRFIFLSTIKVNGEFTLNNAPFTEESDIHPEDPYAHSKLSAENHLNSIRQNTSMETVILRFPLVYGPGVRANFLKMLKLVNKGWPLPFGRINNKRSFVYIDNLISAICNVLTAPQAANQTYLVADDESWSLPALMGHLAKEMDVKVRLLPVPASLLAFAFRVFGLKDLNSRLFGSLEVSNSKIKSQLGWVPPVSSQDGLGKTAKWFKSEYSSS